MPLIKLQWNVYARNKTYVNISPDGVCPWVVFVSLRRRGNVHVWDDLVVNALVVHVRMIMMIFLMHRIVLMLVMMIFLMHRIVPMLVFVLVFVAVAVVVSQ